MLSIIPGDSMLEATCTSNVRKVVMILTEHFEMSRVLARERLECFRNPVDMGKVNPYFMALAIRFDMNFARYKTHSKEERNLWEKYGIPTGSAILAFLSDNSHTVSMLLALTKGRKIGSSLQAQALLRQ